MPSYVLAPEFETAYKRALTRKMRGNRKFQENNLRVAITFYMEGIEMLAEGIPLASLQSEDQYTQGWQPKEKELTIALLSNMVASFLKPAIAEPLQAVIFASHILELVRACDVFRSQESAEFA